ncbi:MAG: SDR family oxidoreductase [Bdellovibrionales bacterium]|nr:SDR family oxidoreductase [Bdellovibrionales bacterium]
MKVLITGAGGFLGSSLVPEMMRAGSKVVAYGRSQSNGVNACDLSSASAICEMLEREKPDVIINCAASVTFAEGALSTMFSVNVMAPIVFADWCKKNGKYLVQISSSSVHGIKAELVNEITAENPDSDYGKSKLMADHAIEASGCDHAIIRFGGIFGLNGPDHLGLNQVIRNARKGVVPVIYGQGKALRNYIHVSDASRLIAFCVSKRMHGVFYGGAELAISIHQMFNEVCEVYLPGQKPDYKEASEASDQIIKLSPVFQGTKTFKEALMAEL